MNHKTTSEPYNIALRHFWLSSQGARVKCPYKAGTRSHKVYTDQINRMKGLAGGYK